MKTAKRYAVIQRGMGGHGFGVYGIGGTPEEAMSQGIGILEYDNEDGDKIKCETVEDVESLITTGRVVGELTIIDSDDPEWQDYII